MRFFGDVSGNPSRFVAGSIPPRDSRIDSCTHNHIPKRHCLGMVLGERGSYSRFARGVNTVSHLFE
jgi:hypothetical protein